MRHKIFQSLLFIRLGLLFAVVFREWRAEASDVEDPCYTMSAPSEPTMCS